jgi:hypothetical protein
MCQHIRKSKMKTLFYERKAPGLEAEGGKLAAQGQARIFSLIFALGFTHLPCLELLCATHALNCCDGKWHASWE